MKLPRLTVVSTSYGILLLFLVGIFSVESASLDEGGAVGLGRAAFLADEGRPIEASSVFPPVFVSATGDGGFLTSRVLRNGTDQVARMNRGFESSWAFDSGRTPSDLQPAICQLPSGRHVAATANFRSVQLRPRAGDGFDLRDYENGNLLFHQPIVAASKVSPFCLGAKEGGENVIVYDGRDFIRLRPTSSVLASLPGVPIQPAFEEVWRLRVLALSSARVSEDHRFSFVSGLNVSTVNEEGFIERVVPIPKYLHYPYTSVKDFSASDDLRRVGLVVYTDWRTGLTSVLVVFGNEVASSPPFFDRNGTNPPYFFSTKHFAYYSRGGEIVDRDEGLGTELRVPAGAIFSESPTRRSHVEPWRPFVLYSDRVLVAPTGKCGLLAYDHKAQEAVLSLAFPDSGGIERGRLDSIVGGVQEQFVGVSCRNGPPGRNGTFLFGPTGDIKAEGLYRAGNELRVCMTLRPDPRIPKSIEVEVDFPTGPVVHEMSIDPSKAFQCITRVFDDQPRGIVLNPSGTIPESDYANNSAKVSAAGAPGLAAPILVLLAAVMAVIARRRLIYRPR